MFSLWVDEFVDNLKPLSYSLRTAKGISSEFVMLCWDMLNDNTISTEYSKHYRNQTILVEELEIHFKGGRYVYIEVVNGRVKRMVLKENLFLSDKKVFDKVRHRILLTEVVKEKFNIVG